MNSFLLESTLRLLIIDGIVHKFDNNSRYGKVTEVIKGDNYYRVRLKGCKYTYTLPPEGSISTPWSWEEV